MQNVIRREPGGGGQRGLLREAPGRGDCFHFAPCPGSDMTLIVVYDINLNRDGAYCRPKAVPCYI